LYKSEDFLSYSLKIDIHFYSMISSCGKIFLIFDKISFLYRTKRKLTASI
jgi:hypothetical protein